MEELTYEEQLREVIKSSNEVIETLNTEGFKIIERIFRDQISLLYKKLRNCKAEELEKIQGTLITFETIINTLDFTRQENKFTKEKLEELEGG